jgi:hypothetical protein
MKQCCGDSPAASPAQQLHWQRVCKSMLSGSSSIALARADAGPPASHCERLPRRRLARAPGGECTAPRAPSRGRAHPTKHPPPTNPTGGPAHFMSEGTEEGALPLLFLGLGA